MRRRITAVVPAWNRAALLPETLDRILGQTRAPDEVIVVDDGSEDDTPAVLRGYAARGVRTVRTANAGDLAARNVGLREAGGDLVAFCDSDDLWDHGYLAAMERLWDVRPDLRAAYGNFRIVRDGIWSDATKFDDAPPRFWDDLLPLCPRAFVFEQPIAPRLVRFQPFFPAALVADRAFLVGIGGWDEGVSGLIGRDFATALRIAEHAPLGILRNPLVGVRKHGSNDSGDVLAMNLGDADVLDHVIRTRPLYAPHAAAFRDSAAARRGAALDTAFVRGRFDDVRRIASMLPPDRMSPLTRIKRMVAALPEPARAVLARLVLAVGTLKGRFAGGR